MTLIPTELRQRILTGVGLALVAALIIFLGGTPLILVLLLISGLAMFEFLSVTLPPYRTDKNVIDSDAFLYALGFSTVPVGLAFGGLQGAASTFVLCVTLMILREMRLFESNVHEENSRDSLTAIALTLVYPLLFSLTFLGGVLLIQAKLGGDSWRVLGWYIITVAVNDIGAYFFGRLFGKKLLSPRVSPKKSCEGAIGGLLLAVLLSVLLGRLLGVPVADGTLLVVAILTSSLCQLGDLVESFVKRIYGVKDMGSILPGHGGVLDRLDGHLFAAPVLILLSELM